MSDKNMIPNGWEKTKLGDIAELVGGGTPSRKKPEYFTGNIVWLTPSQIPKNKITIIKDSDEKITDEGLKHSSAKILPEGTVLMTSRASIGYIAIAGTEVTTNQGFASFICSQKIYNWYLAYWLMKEIPEIEQQATGTTFKEISKTKLKNFHIYFPTFHEQKCIVSKIEELFSQLDAGVVGLKRARAELKRYRASVLKAAFEGRLVPQDLNDEQVSELLKIINLEPNIIKKVNSLPDSWAWVKIEDVADTTSGGTPLRSKSEYFGGDIHWIKSGELRDKIINNSEEKITELGLNESSAKIFKKGTTVVALYGATVGKTGILNIDAATNQAICAVFPKNNIILNKYLFYWFQHKRQELINLSIGGAQPNISQRIIRSLLFPLSPLKEQIRIVIEIERQMSIIENIKNSIGNRITNASYLHQAILKSAFSGKLITKHHLES